MLDVNIVAKKGYLTVYVGASKKKQQKKNLYICGIISAVVNDYSLYHDSIKNVLKDHEPKSFLRAPEYFLLIALMLLVLASNNLR